MLQSGSRISGVTSSAGHTAKTSRENPDLITAGPVFSRRTIRDVLRSFPT